MPGDKRKLYAFCLVECHSRMMYVEFTHSQSFETFVRCHVHAFQALGGVARERWYDNLATAVAEHDGNLVRFHPRFLAFAREFGFFPVPVMWRRPGKKAKSSASRSDICARTSGLCAPSPTWPMSIVQVRQWLDEVANQPPHRETGQTPDERFRPRSLRPLPALAPDYRDTAEALVHKDLRLDFDGNRYCVPPRYVGHRLTVKADSPSADHLPPASGNRPLCPLLAARPDASAPSASRKNCLPNAPPPIAPRAQQRLVALLGARAELTTCEAWPIPTARCPARFPNCSRWSASTDRSRRPALDKAHAARAFGADYVANILRQQQYAA